MCANGLSSNMKLRLILKWGVLCALLYVWIFAERSSAVSCGGCYRASDEWEAVCYRTISRTRRVSYRTCTYGYWRTMCSTGYRTEWYYARGSAFCCSSHLQRGTTCAKNGCGGCSGRYGQQRACTDRDGYGTYYRCCSGYRPNGHYCVSPTTTTTPRPSAPPPTTSPAGGACGVSKYSNAGSGVWGAWIVGGRTARPNEFPWQVLLRTTSSNSPFCGGTIIDKDNIITSANCARAVSSLRVYVGVQRLSSTASTQQVRGVAGITVHPRFDSNTFANDVAMVRLSAPLTFNANVHAACLPTSKDQNNVNRNVIIGGWGSTSANGPSSDTLQYAGVRVASSAYCKRHFGDSYIGPSVMCATDGTGDDDKSPCWGDAGGPMVVKETDGKWHLIGVASFIASCARGHPFAYQDVSYHLDWINSQTGGACGVSKYSNAGAGAWGAWIVGGRTTRPNEFPWQVSLRTTSSNSHFCGGTIIDKDNILTAAHCARGRPVSNFRVYAGVQRLSATESTQQVRTVAEITVHPSYNHRALAYDVAVVRLASSLRLDANVSPACLPTSSRQNHVNRNVLISGWGRTSTGGSLSDSLLFAGVQVAAPSVCLPHYGSIGPTVLCVTDGRGDDDKSACNGDSGGPMVVKESDGKWHVIGVASFVHSDGCAGGVPFGYQDVSYMLDWITNQMP